MLTGQFTSTTPSTQKLPKSVLFGLRGLKIGNNSGVEDLLDVNIEQSRAFDVGSGAQLSRQLLALLLSNRLLILAIQVFKRDQVVSEIDLSADEHEGNIRHILFDLGYPFLLDVEETRRLHDREAHDEDVRGCIRHDAQFVPVLLTSRVE